uniref:Putative disease resistance protein RDL5 n=1 Tax=Noccaea caerulescens TaxID=107243 RepID=A0A1J3DNZ8_NOCCA
MFGELVMSFGLGILWELVSQQYAQFQGVEDQVTELKADLKTLKSFLKDADAKNHTSAMVRNFVEVIKEIICDAEEILETFVLKDEIGKNGGIKKVIRRLPCIIPQRREIALEIGSLNKRISKVTRDIQSFGVQHIIADRRDSQPHQERQEFARYSESNLVGLEANVKNLVDEDNVQAVSISGMSGLGKTTLSREVFNHAMVKNKFDGLTCVCVSQEFTGKSVCQTILRNLRTSEEEDKIMKMTEVSQVTLQDELFRLLETSKWLIVFDDIWKEEDGNRMKPLFPSEKGWKVLFTSRNGNVVGCGDTTYSISILHSNA